MRAFIPLAIMALVMLPCCASRGAGERPMNRPETAPRLVITMLVWTHPDGEARLAQFAQRAAPLFRRYGVEVDRVLTPVGKGSLVGENPHEVPDLIQVLSMPSLDRFQAYTSDPEYQKLAKERDMGVRRMVAVLGTPLSAIDATTSTSPLNERRYGVAFARFKPGGQAGMLEFNRRASGLFARHGMHVEAMVDTVRILAPIGAPLEAFAPERVVVFFLDSAAAMPAYLADPEYRQLAPVRDEGLERYDFFTATATGPEPTAGVDRFLAQVASYAYDFTDFSEVRIVSATLEGGVLVTDYEYRAGAELMRGQNRLQRRGKRFEGTWATKSSSGATFEGPVWLEFAADGSANGSWRNGSGPPRAIRIVRAAGHAPQPALRD